MAALLTVAVALSVVLLGVVAAGAVAGEFGALSGGELRRCERCHRLGLVSRAKVHDAACPLPRFHAPSVSARLELPARRLVLDHVSRGQPVDGAVP